MKCSSQTDESLHSVLLLQVTLGQAKFLMVMENLNFDRRIAMQYDLKGLVHGRLAPDSAQVRLDQNFLNDMKRLRLHLNPYLKQDLQTVIRNDTAFLSVSFDLFTEHVFII